MTAAPATSNAQLESLKTVKLSKQTIGFLKNFSQINKSILIKRGNFIDTISVNKNIIAYTDIKEFIPTDMAIYDLPLFLGALSLFETPTLHFPDDKKVVIFDAATKAKTTYYYSDPEIIGKVPEFDPNLPEKAIEFDLPQADITSLMQAARVYGVEDLCVQGYGGAYSVCVKDKKNDTSNVFSLPLRKVLFSDPAKTTEEERNFDYTFKVENLKLIEGSYHVCISKKKIANFYSLSYSSLNYFIALEP